MDGEPQGASGRGRGEREEIRGQEEKRRKMKVCKNEDKVGENVVCKTQKGDGRSCGE